VQDERFPGLSASVLRQYDYSTEAFLNYSAHKALSPS
jgi:hypothetical protein